MNASESSPNTNPEQNDKLINFDVNLHSPYASSVRYTQGDTTILIDISHPTYSLQSKSCLDIKLSNFTCKLNNNYNNFLIENIKNTFEPIILFTEQNIVLKINIHIVSATPLTLLSIIINSLSTALICAGISLVTFPISSTSLSNNTTIVFDSNSKILTLLTEDYIKGSSNLKLEIEECHLAVKNTKIKIMSLLVNTHKER